MENNSSRLGLMAVVAVSGSMVFLVHQVHKRLLYNFMEKFEFEMGGISYAHSHKNFSAKKKLRFAKQALENKSCHASVTRVPRIKAEEIYVQKLMHGPNLEDIMPPNRAALYRGILKYQNGTVQGRLCF